MFDFKRSHSETAVEVINAFAARYEHYWLEGMLAKTGLSTREEVTELLAKIEREKTDWTLTFRSFGPQNPAFIPRNPRVEEALSAHSERREPRCRDVVTTSLAIGRCQVEGGPPRQIVSLMQRGLADLLQTY